MDRHVLINDECKQRDTRSDTVDRIVDTSRSSGKLCTGTLLATAIFHGVLELPMAGDTDILCPLKISPLA